MQRFEHRFKAMGGPARLLLDCPEQAIALAAIDAAEAELKRLEAKYSRYLSDSLITAINNAAGGDVVPVDEETAGLLNHADTLWRESDGAFDITAGVLRRAWDFSSGRLPTAAQLESLLKLVGWGQVTWDKRSISLPAPGMELDLGGYVKEYAADCVVGLLHQQGLEHALVDLAGDIAVTGPRGDGSPWPVAIRSPDKGSAAIAAVELSSGALASSGDYERCIEIEGERYGHILDSRTGWPVKGLAAVSITAAQCLVAGSAATLALLRQQSEALDWLGELGLPWLAVDQKMAVYGGL